MPTNNKKDIYRRNINYSSISLISNKLKVGIIGGERVEKLKPSIF